MMAQRTRAVVPPDRGAASNCRNGPFQLKTIEGSNGPVVRADRAGRLWLVIGTDSGFEGTTRIYYVDGRVTIVPVAGN